MKMYRALITAHVQYEGSHVVSELFGTDKGALKAAQIIVASTIAPEWCWRHLGAGMECLLGDITYEMTCERIAILGDPDNAPEFPVGHLLRTLKPVDPERDLAHEADMEELRREQLAADVGDSDDFDFADE